jgi:hypothetical protein
MHLVVIGTPRDRRIQLLQEALSNLKLPAARIASYADLLAGRIHLDELVQSGSIVRVESPGRDFDVEKQLLMAGAASAALEPYMHVDQETIARAEFDKGRIWFPRQWYLGFCQCLRQISEQLDTCPSHHRMNAVPEIETMFDKPACHALLSAHDLPVPRSLGVVNSFDTLIDAMQKQRCFRVFIKLAHGSSASGAVAYQWDGDRHRAITTVEVVSENRQTRLYNSRRVRTIFDVTEIRRLIDALCRHRVHVEQWIPKAAHHNQVFDLRAVVIGGKVRHCIVRLSDSPMTNLHLLNGRTSLDSLSGQMPPGTWASAVDTCQNAALLFPGSLHCGIDLMFQPGYRQHHILEINAFGDLLPGLLDQGQSTYEAEIGALREQARC